MKKTLLFFIVTLVSLFLPTFSPIESNPIPTGCGYGNTNISFDDVILQTKKAENLFDYYSNLTTNIGDNPSVLCVGVASCMVASYYDTYFNDGIIPEIYEEREECFNQDYDYYQVVNSSPGIFSQIPSNCYNQDGTPNESNVNSYLQNNHDFMLEIYYSGHLVNRTSLDPYPYSSIGNFFSYIHEYYTPNVSFQVTMLATLNSYENEIDSGNPIVMLIPSGNGAFHAVVAFAYDSNGNFYYHNGYKDGNSYGVSVFGITNGSYMAYSISVENTSQHACSNNYYSIDDNVTTYYCPCMLNGMSYPNHNHQHFHGCDYFFDEDDELVLTGVYYEACLSCGLSKTHLCDVVSITQHGYEQHQISYSCGQTHIDHHFIIDFECVTGDGHIYYCICGGIADEDHDECLPVMINNTLTYVCICGFIDLDHNDYWRAFIKDYLYDYSYFDVDFFNELIIEILSNPPIC